MSGKNKHIWKSLFWCSPSPVYIYHSLALWNRNLFPLGSSHFIPLSSPLASIRLHTLIAGAYGELISLLCCPVRLWGLLLLTVLADADGWKRRRSAAFTERLGVGCSAYHTKHSEQGRRRTDGTIALSRKNMRTSDITCDSRKRNGEKRQSDKQDVRFENNSLCFCVLSYY